MGLLTFAAASYALRSIYQRLERRGIFQVDEDVARRPTAWIDSLRGIAALGVISANLIACLAPWMQRACCSSSTTGRPHIFQLPPFRALAASPSWLALFFILSSLSSSLAPLQLSRSGRLEQAYLRLSRSALKRPLRFVPHASIATLISWTILQIGGYQFAEMTKIPLISVEGLSRKGDGILAGLTELMHALVRTWVWPAPENRLETQQTALVWMLEGSYLTYCVLMMTMTLKSLARLTVALVVMWLSFAWDWRLSLTIQTGLAYMTGMLLADLWVSAEVRHRMENFSGIASPAMIAIGLVFMSWAKDFSRLLWWTTLLDTIVLKPLPTVRNPEMLMGTLGAALVVGAVLISPRIRTALTKPLLLWLGKISFAICLVNLMVIRLALPWLVYINNPFKAIFNLRSSDSGALEELFEDNPGIFRKLLGSMVVFILTLSAAQVWTRQVETKLKKVTARVEMAFDIREDWTAQEFVERADNGILPEHVSYKAV